MLLIEHMALGALIISLIAHRRMLRDQRDWADFYRSQYQLLRRSTIKPAEPTSPVDDDYGVLNFVAEMERTHCLHRQP